MTKLVSYTTLFSLTECVVQLQKIFLVVLCLVGLSACVTTEDNLFTADTSVGRAVESRVNLAMSYYQKGDTESARRNLDAALKLDAKDPSVHNALALLFSKEGEYELAERHFKKAVKLDSTYSTARNNYAAFLYNQQRYKAAMTELEYVVSDELYKERLLAMGNLGRVAMKLGDTNKAVSAFERMLNMDSRNKLALLELANINFDAGKFTMAQALYDKYRAVTLQQSPRGLVLGIRLAEEIINSDARASYALALKNLYPKSAEYKHFLSGNYN